MSFKIRTDASGNGQFTIDSTDVLSINTNTTVSLPTGTANGVAYLNGSKVLTSGSALTFDGTNLGTGGIAFADASTQSTGGYTGFRNRIINGAMMIDQRNAGASVTTSVLQSMTYTLDRWAYYNDVVSKRTIQQVTTAPAGFSNSLKVTVIATDTVGPQQFIRQSIEGFNIADLAWGTASAQPVTLSFWVRSSVTGQHGGSLQNNSSARSYPIAYTINAADTWEYKTITIAGDTSGTWLTNNGTGIVVIFEHGVGYQKSAAGAWVGQNTTSSTGSVNLCATNGATWYITGVQLEKGSVATPFEFRPYGQELALCKRYYQKFGACGGSASSSQIHAAITFPVEMRDTPSAYGVVSGGTCVQLNRAIFSITSISGTYNSSKNGAGLFINSSDTGLNVGSVAWALSDSIYATSEL